MTQDFFQRFSNTLVALLCGLPCFIIGITLTFVHLYGIFLYVYLLMTSQLINYQRENIYFYYGPKARGAGKYIWDIRLCSDKSERLYGITFCGVLSPTWNDYAAHLYDNRTGKEVIPVYVQPFPYSKYGVEAGTGCKSGNFFFVPYDEPYCEVGNNKTYRLEIDCDKPGSRCKQMMHATPLALTIDGTLQTVLQMMCYSTRLCKAFSVVLLVLTVSFGVPILVVSVMPLFSYLFFTINTPEICFEASMLLIFAVCNCACYLSLSYYSDILDPYHIFFYPDGYYSNLNLQDIFSVNICLWTMWMPLCHFVLTHNLRHFLSLSRVCPHDHQHGHHEPADPIWAQPEGMRCTTIGKIFGCPKSGPCGSLAGCLILEFFVVLNDLNNMIWNFSLGNLLHNPIPREIFSGIENFEFFEIVDDKIMCFPKRLWKGTQIIRVTLYLSFLDFVRDIYILGGNFQYLLFSTDSIGIKIVAWVWTCAMILKEVFLSWYVSRHLFNDTRRVYAPCTVSYCCLVLASARCLLHTTALLGLALIILVAVFCGTAVVVTMTAFGLTILPILNLIMNVGW